MEAFNRLTMPLLDFKAVRINHGRVEVIYNGRDRLTREPARLVFVEEAPHCWSTMSEEERISWVKLCIENAVKHELAEFFFVAGLGPDPHLSEYVDEA